MQTFVIVNAKLLNCQVLVQRTWKQVARTLEIVDFVILAIFLVEISVKFLAFGKPFICDPWNAFDAFIVLFSIGLAILESVVTDETVKQVLGLKGVLRILRLVLIFRRASEAQSSLGRVKYVRSGVNIASPVERVLDTLNVLARSRHLARTTRWALYDSIEIVASGQLYEPVGAIDANLQGEMDEEASAWINTGTKAKNQARRGDSIHAAHTESNFISAAPGHNQAIESSLHQDKLCDWGLIRVSSKFKIQRSTSRQTKTTLCSCRFIIFVE